MESKKVIIVTTVGSLKSKDLINQSDKLGGKIFIISRFIK